MRSYAETVFWETARRMLEFATDVVARLPEDPEARCHEVARVVYLLLQGKYPLEYDIAIVDGRYRHVDHSWVRIPGGRQADPVILDPYVVGRLPMVQLVDCSMGLGEHYVVGRPRTDIRKEWVDAQVVHFRKTLGLR